MTTGDEPLSPFATPGDALAHQSATRPDAEAFVFPEADARLTFGEWHAQAAALARALIDRGYKTGDHIGILAETRIEWPVAQMGIALMGGVMVPLNSHYRAEDLLYALQHSGATALFLSDAFRSNAYRETVEALRSDLATLRDVFSFDEEDGYSALLAAGRESTTVLPDVDPDSVGSLQYTSGTTGFPKGALLTHRGMLSNAWGITGRLRVTESDRWTSIIPLFHCAGCIMCVQGTLQRGSTYIGVPAFDPIGMFKLIEDERCTMLSGVPTSYLAMLQHPERARFDLSTLRAGTCGGADTDPDLLQECAETFPISGVVQVYGQTEASTLISLADCADAKRFHTCGPPLPGAAVRITDPETRTELPAGQIGEIETQGPMVMRGYYANPDATAETIAGDGWMRTGDLGYLTEDGNIVVAGGRLRDMIIRGGENIYPVEIENVLRPHPTISDIAVFGISDDYYGEAVAAAVVRSGDLSRDDLAEFCDGRIARFKVPARLFEMDAFPLTASGKVRKSDLRDLAESGQLTELE